MKTMFTEISKTLIVTAKNTITRDKFNELETTVECLAQSSVSPDVLREILSLIDNITESSVSNNNSSKISSLLPSLYNKIEQIYTKLQSNKQFCIDINQSVNIASNDQKALTERLPEQIDFIKKVQEKNEKYLKEVKNILQLLGNESKL